MVIICDVDGVVADLHTPWLKRYNEKSGDNLTVDKLTTWHVSEFVLPDWEQKVFDILREPNLYEDVLPILFALDAIRTIQESHRVVFTTSCVKGMADQKWDWLERWGFLPKRYSHSNLVITADKSLIAGDLIIDDSFEHCKAFESFAILFDQPWNRNDVFDASWCERAVNWPDVVSKIEAACERV